VEAKPFRERNNIVSATCQLDFCGSNFSQFYYLSIVYSGAVKIKLQLAPKFTLLEFDQERDNRSNSFWYGVAF
jgi:hypothetical protein